jgi:hypothetical protein
MTCRRYPEKVEALLAANEPPLECAARHLRDIQEHLDPTERGSVPWEHLREIERSFYRSTLQELVFRTELLDACLIQLSGDNSVDRGSELRE